MWLVSSTTSIPSLLGGVATVRGGSTWDVSVDAAPSAGAGEPREGSLLVEGTSQLFYREIGGGQPVIVLHGGPDFDHSYLRPELDGLAECCRLVYYDQRGRGRSSAGVGSEQVSLDTEVEDIERVRHHLVGGPVAIVGHSWGGLLAMEYALRHPEQVSRLVLMNTAPASCNDAAYMKEQLRHRRAPRDVEEMQQLVASVEYQQGDLELDRAYHRLHFGPAFRQQDLLDELVGRLRKHFTPEGLVTARAIEQRLYDDTWSLDGYDLVPGLRRLDTPALVIHGAHDFIPTELARRIADAMPRGVLDVLPESGHFAYLEQPDEVRSRICGFVASQ